MSDYEKEFYWYWMSNLKGIGLRTRGKLLEGWGHPSVLYDIPGDQLEDFLDPKQMEIWNSSKDYTKLENGLKQLREEGVRFLHLESEDYPERLRDLYDPPTGLYLKGELPDPAQPAVAIVGSRKSTPYGRKMADYFAGRLAGQGIAIISGMAAGIDSAAHRSTLAHGGYTLGILGGGIDTMYPKDNWDLYLDMYKKGGIMSEYNLGVLNHAALFPMRNRLISGIADAVLVVEAAFKSGSLITADQGMEQGKDIYALPGRVTDAMSQGCNHLIAQGAFLAESPEKMIEEILERNQLWKNRVSSSSSPELTGSSGLSSSTSAAGSTSIVGSTSVAGSTGQSSGTFASFSGKSTNFFQEISCSDRGKTILNLLDYNDPVSLNDLLEQTNFRFSELNHEITQLELQGFIYQPQPQLFLKQMN